MPEDDDSVERFLEKAGQQRRPPLIREFAIFLVHSKKWWLAPILLALAAMAWLAFSAGGALPFIYVF